MPVARVLVYATRSSQAFILLAVVAAWGCAKQEARPPDAQAQPNPQTSAEPPAPADAQSDVAAQAARQRRDLAEAADEAAAARQYRELAESSDKAQQALEGPSLDATAQAPVAPMPPVDTAAQTPQKAEDSGIERSLGAAPVSPQPKARARSLPISTSEASEPPGTSLKFRAPAVNGDRAAAASKSKPLASSPDVGAGDTVLQFREGEPSVEMPSPPTRTPAPTVGPVMPSGAPRAATVQTPATESAPFPPSAAAAAKPPATASAPASRSKASGEFTMVKVHYGTDRAPVDESVPAGFSAAAWYWFTSSLAGLTIALALGCWRFPTSRVLRWGSACGLIVTAGLGLATIQARHRPQSTDDPTVRRLYSNRRGSLELGICEVSIPKAHTVGAVERPSLLKLEFRENPLKHVVLESVRMQSADEFYASLKTRVDGSGRKEAMVFVHGFNVSFESAARRTAQIAYDLKFDGAPVFFSWPSHGGLLGYTIDETNVVWTVPHLKQFLVDVAQRSGAKQVHLVAHSMGNRALTSALRELYYELNKDCPRFGEVVLTAPDIDAEVFRRDLVPSIVRTAERVTLYASSNDEALVLSKKVHGYPRAGDSGAELIVLPGMDTIDVSAVDTSLLGHSYYGNNLTVLADLFDLLHEAKPAESRPWLAPVQAGTLRYWIFKHIQEAALGRERL